MSLSTSNSKKAIQTGTTEQVKRFATRILLPFLLIVGTFCYMVDRVMRDRVIFRTPILGAAKIHRSIHRRSPEIPILGSSRALGSYIPDSLSLRSYNYGINGTGYEVVDLFLQIETKRNHAKTAIIINFDYEMWNEALGDLNNYIPNIRHPEVRSLLKKHDAYKLWYEFFGLRFFSSFDIYLKDYINYRVQLTKVVTLGASLEKNELPKAQWDKLVRKRLATKTTWEPKTDQMERLRKHIRSRPDRMFYIVVAPYHKSYYESFVGIEAAHKFLADIDTIPNVQVINIDGRDYPDELFVNTSHINYEGAKRFTKEVRTAIFGNNPGESPEPLIWPPGYEPEWYLEQLRLDSMAATVTGE